ncbi:hypothetical protein BIW11_04990 [Tropilaelaps mercedesae]|uniref:Uncharacterized protein n=1 Tax=Tropilaelaps mercedesae TaxID=418985 RepID=A0A1V9WZ43_9ACAR|nr:hypothetical protein BIW11_04990 [Tropilaelaps mercedesae]
MDRQWIDRRVDRWIDRRADGWIDRKRTDR